MMLRLRTHADAPGERDQIAYEFEDPLLELVRLLHEASEVEHALLVQYLYAAFSIKLPRYKSLAGSGFSASADDLLGVAIQEMQHLDVANRMLVAVGASP
ncbi:MAG: ferritin-like domain-containing protein, partial [Candidatus Nanopelagicales bacterium]